MLNPRHDIVVVGGAAGAVEALLRFVPELPADLPAAIFITLHDEAGDAGALPELLSRVGKLPTQLATHGAPFQHGHIYLAPPDRHLTLEKRRMTLVLGPRENGYRPAVDPLFRSAAQAFGTRVIGLVLSGGLDDGTAGLMDIKLHGGIALAQDPSSALYSGMPQSAVSNVELDHIVQVDKMARRLVELVSGSATARAPAEPRKRLARTPSAAAPRKPAAELPPVPQPAFPQNFSCPDCGGAMWELTSDKQLRYRCHTGHTHSSITLGASQDRLVENALWTAIRALQEAAELRRRMAVRLEKHARPGAARDCSRRAKDADRQADVLRDLLLANGGAGDPKRQGVAARNGRRQPTRHGRR
jgi:two-component system chemotaxis response regulator CheB